MLEEQLLCRCRKRRDQERSSLHHETAGRSALPGTGDGQERVRLVRKVNYRTEGIDSGARGGGSEQLVPHNLRRELEWPAPEVRWWCRISR